MIQWKDINKYRVLIMGVAALLVVFVHLHGSELAPLWLQQIQRFCQNGVDIFLFLSGIGCFYSMSKNTIKNFYKHRIARILPSIIIVLGLDAIIKVGYWGYDWKTFLIECGPFGLFRGYTGGWYVDTILILYIITPLLYQCFQKKNALYWFLFAIITIGTAQLQFFDHNNIINTIRELFLDRIPIYMLGIAMGKYIQMHEENTIDLFSKQWILSSVILFIIYFINSFYNKAYTMDVCHLISLLLAPILVLWLSLLFSKVNSNFFKNLGKVSLELYLVNEKVIKVLYVYFAFPFDFILNITAFLISLFLANAIREMSQKINSYII